VLVALACFSCHAAETSIVRDGKPLAAIVISSTPARMTKLAARELQTYVAKITGARLEITNAPTRTVPVTIYVGRSRFTDALHLNADDLNYGAFRIASGPDWLALLGPDRDYEPVKPWGRSRAGHELERVNEEWAAIAGDPFFNPFYVHFRHYYPDQDVWAFDEAGTLNAVYSVLRELGVRWYAPGELGEVVPQMSHIAIPTTNRVVRPDFPVRNFMYPYMQHGVGKVGIWNLRLGFNPGHRVLGHVQLCHGLKYVLMRPEMREAHPEFYAIRGGERDTLAPCPLAEGLLEKHVAYVRALFDHYNEPMVNIDLPDGFGNGCECERCRARRTPERGPDGLTSDLVFSYIDCVARQICRSHPDRIVGALAYSSYRLPPQKIDKLSPNLAITWSRASKRRTLYSDSEALEQYRRRQEQWLKVLPSGKLFIWESYLHARPRHGAAIPAVYPHSIAADLRELKGISQGDMVETYQHQEFSNQRPYDHGHKYDAFAINHLNVYVTARLWWDTETDLDALLDEYYRLYYGPARAQMQAFFEYSEANWRELSRDAERIGAVLERIEAAQAAVDPGSVYGRRVALVAEYVRPLYALRKQLQRPRAEDIPRARALRVHALAGKTLDGRLDDPQYWPEVRTLPLRDLKTGKWPSRELGTWTRIFRDQDALYFGVYCSEPDMESLKRATTGGAERGIRSEDFVEILLETTSHSYYRIRVDPNGVVEEADMGDGRAELRWRSGADVAVHLGEDHWSVELRLPLAGEGVREEEPLSGIDGRMPSEAFLWYFNIGRQRLRDGAVERLAYAPTGTNEFAVSKRFAQLWSK